MAQYKLIQSSFIGGEISPRMLGRVDLKTYTNSVKDMTNAYPFAHGGVTSRYGTTYIDSLSDSSNTVRLIPFVYSRTNSYCLVLNNGKIEFVRNKAFISSSGSPEVHYSIAHPYSDQELAELTYAQSGNVMIFCHSNHVPKILSRIADDDWALDDLTFIYNAVSDYTFENHFIKFKIITAGDGHSVDDYYTINTDGAGGFTQAGPIAGGATTPVGDMVAVEINQNAVVAQTWTITCIYASDTREEWAVVGSVSGSPPVQWSSANYPAGVAFYEQRLYFGGTTLFPQTVWGSVAGDYFNLTGGAEDNDAVTFTIASNRYDAITHLESARQLLPLTYGCEFYVAGPTGSTITPSAVAIRACTFHGSNNVKPMRIGQEILFVQRNGKKLRAINYDYAQDTNIAPDVTILAEHITGSVDGIVDMTYAADPDAIAWLVRDDGYMLTLTYLKEQEVTAWAKHNTTGLFKAVTSIADSDFDTVYVAVEREINNSTVLFLEYFTPDLYLDCAKYASSEIATNTFTGFDHLEGEEVAIVADGRVHGPVIVTSGTITLTRAVNEVYAGSQFSPSITLLHPEFSVQDGSIQGRAVRVNQITLRLQDTLGCDVNGIECKLHTFPLMLDAAPLPFTGDYAAQLDTGWLTPNNITISNPLPMAWTVLATISKVEVTDK